MNLTSEFSISNKMYRLLWWSVQNTIFYFSFRQLHVFRVFVLRVFGAKIGRSVKVYRNVSIWDPRNLELGDNVTVGDNVDLYNVNNIKIGKGTIISQYSFLCTASHDFRDVDFKLTSSPISIGESSWVAADVFIAPGVAIGSRCMVGARSSVFSSLEKGRSLKGGVVFRGE